MWFNIWNNANLSIFLDRYPVEINYLKEARIVFIVYDWTRARKLATRIMIDLSVECFFGRRRPSGLPRSTVNEHPNLKTLQFQNVMIPIKFTLGISKQISFKFWIDLRIIYQINSFTIIEFKVTTAYFCLAVTCNFFMISDFNQICSAYSYHGYIYQYFNYSVSYVLRKLLFTTYQCHSRPSTGVTIDLPMKISKWNMSISLFTVGWLNVISYS